MRACKTDIKAQRESITIILLKILSNGWFQSDGNWKDKLTNYNGQSIIYDTIGNPTDYRGMDMSWQGGRQLAAVIIRNNPNTPNTTLSFEYNEAGLRTEKKVNNVKHTYYWTNGKLSAEICEGSYSLFFHYDANGDILGFSYKVGETATEYYYIKNLQGDVLKVINSSGTVVAEYSYNAWGQILTSSGAMAAINPIRYRGYYYDTETRFYYLQSRYYDPEVGRFVNADDAGYLGANGSLTSYNLFAYCGNSPVICSDKDGYRPIVDTVDGKESQLERSISFASMKVNYIDLTGILFAFMCDNVDTLSTYKEKYGFIKAALFFYQNVKDGGALDIKLTEEWKFKDNTIYSFNGIILRYDDPGNINFGYVGAILFPKWVLCFAAGLNQIGKYGFKFGDFSTFFDDPRDNWMIKYGYDLYWR